MFEIFPIYIFFPSSLVVELEMGFIFFSVVFDIAHPFPYCVLVGEPK